ncbi:MAG TPA: hypothetical protein VIB79_22295 [Candidatus Binatia bacterium]|jgi:hypothetical protein
MVIEQISLFENAPLGVESKSADLTLVAGRDRPLTKAQQTFNRLIKSIEALRAKLKSETRRLDDALAYYGKHLHARLQRQTELRKTLVRTLAVFLDHKRLNGKKARSTLCAVIADELEAITAEEGVLAEDDLRALFERVSGHDFEGAAREDFDDARREIESMFSNFGIEIDLSDMELGMSDEDLAVKAAKMKVRLEQEIEKQQRSFTPTPRRRKTARQLEREKREKLAEEARKKTVATIYKQLARVLHPDLELDPARKKDKETLMQELTVAYSNNDMHTLLRLETEWIEREEGEIARLSDEKLAVYNETLKEQVEELQQELRELPCHPRYQPITVFNGPFKLTVRTDGPAEAFRLDQTNASMEASIRDLTSSNGLETLRAILRSYREEQRASKWELNNFPF